MNRKGVKKYMLTRMICKNIILYEKNQRYVGIYPIDCDGVVCDEKFDGVELWYGEGILPKKQLGKVISMLKKIHKSMDDF